MIETIIVGLIAVLFAFMTRFKGFKWGLEAAFVLLTTFVAIRYNWGNDYPGYLGHFKTITRYSVLDYDVLEQEKGWIFLNYISKPIGFFGLTILLTVFEYFILYRLIKKYVPKRWYWLAVLIFTFNTAFLLVTSSMMRQFLAMCIFIIAVDYIVDKRWFIAILLISLASLFHTSALILLPFAFFGYIDFTFSNTKAVIIFAILFVLYFTAAALFGDYIMLLLQSENFDRYEVYVGYEQTALGTGLGVIFNMILLFVVLMQQKYQSPKMKVVFILFLFSFVFTLFGSIAPLIGRLAYYFSIFTIVCYPLMFNTMKNKLLRNLLMGIYFIVMIKGFFDFFSPSGIWYKMFYNYQTVFSSLGWQ